VVVSSPATGCCNIEISIFRKFASIQKSQNRSANINGGQLLVFDSLFYFFLQYSRVNRVNSLGGSSHSTVMKLHISQKKLNNVVIWGSTTSDEVYVIHHRNRNSVPLNLRHLHPPNDSRLGRYLKSLGKNVL